MQSSGVRVESSLDAGRCRLRPEEEGLMISDQSRAEEMRRKLGKPYLLGPYRKHPAACMDKMCMCITVCEDQYGRSELGVMVR
jgi:hypothetical protein